MLLDISDATAAPGRKQIRFLTPTDSITELTVMLHAAYARLGAMGFNYTAVNQPEEVTRERVLRGDCLLAVDEGGILDTAIFHARSRSEGCPCYQRPDVATIGQLGALPGQQGLNAEEIQPHSFRARTRSLRLKKAIASFSRTH